MIDLHADRGQLSMGDDPNHPVLRHIASEYDLPAVLMTVLAIMRLLIVPKKSPPLPIETIPIRNRVCEVLTTRLLIAVRIRDPRELQSFHS